MLPVWLYPAAFAAAVALLAFLFWLERNAKRADDAEALRLDEIRAGIERGLAADANRAAFDRLGRTR